ncbi:MAG: ribokinase, partial [Candidatus Marinimicrobia bacterium]|nr:ribokinase [Candidatus Neomarinimicrobiota bacterium]
MEKPKIVVVGSSNTDMVIKLERLPGPGETIIGGDFIMAAGGKGANQAVAAARLGGEVTFVARVGTDMFGKQAIQNFQHEGINTHFIIEDDFSPSGVALIFVDRKGENSIAVASGANSKLS